MVLGFCVWVHHMFATGLPPLPLSFFSAASFVIVIPSAFVVFAWLATIWSTYFVVGHVGMQIAMRMITSQRCNARSISLRLRHLCVGHSNQPFSVESRIGRSASPSEPSQQSIFKEKT